MRGWYVHWMSYGRDPTEEEVTTWKYEGWAGMAYFIKEANGY